MGVKYRLGYLGFHRKKGVDLVDLILDRSM